MKGLYTLSQLEAAYNAAPPEIQYLWCNQMMSYYYDTWVGLTLYLETQEKYPAYFDNDGKIKLIPDSE